jgi:hypothetical protein
LRAVGGSDLPIAAGRGEHDVAADRRDVGDTWQLRDHLTLAVAQFHDAGAGVRDQQTPVDVCEPEHRRREREGGNVVVMFGGERRKEKSDDECGEQQSRRASVSQHVDGLHEVEGLSGRQMLLADGLPTGRLQRVSRKIPRSREVVGSEFTKTRLKTAIASGPIRYVLAGASQDGVTAGIFSSCVTKMARRGSSARPRTIPTAALWATPPSASGVRKGR